MSATLVPEPIISKRRVSQVSRPQVLTINKHKYEPIVEMGQFTASCNKCGSNRAVARVVSRSGEKDVYCRRCLAYEKQGKKINTHWSNYMDCAMQISPYPHPQNTSNQTRLDSLSKFIVS